MKNNAEALDYVEELKEKLIESFTCFIHAFSTSPPYSDIIMSRFFKLLEFIQHTCDARVNPTIVIFIFLLFKTKIRNISEIASISLVILVNIIEVKQVV